LLALHGDAERRLVLRTANGPRAAGRVLVPRAQRNILGPHGNLLVCNFSAKRSLTRHYAPTPAAGVQRITIPPLASAAMLAASGKRCTDSMSLIANGMPAPFFSTR